MHDGLTLGRMRLRHLFISVALVAFVLVVVGLISALRSFDPDPHRAVLNELEIPRAWELAHEETTLSIPPIDAASRVVRYYFVDADPTETVMPAQRMFVEAGFTIQTQLAPRDWCDDPPYDSKGLAVCPRKRIAPCSMNGPTGPTTCYFYASRGTECVTFRALDRGEMATYFRGLEGFHVSDPVRIVVSVADHYAGPVPCQGL